MYKPENKWPSEFENKNHIFVDLNIDYEDIKNVLSQDLKWENISPKKYLGYKQKYFEYQPKWLIDQFKLPIWSYIGFLVACQKGENLCPHTDNGRTCAINIPAVPDYDKTTLEFWDFPDWQYDQKWPDTSKGTKIEEVAYNSPILIRNRPHAVDNTSSEYDRITLSISFMPPYEFEVIADLIERGLLLE